MKSALKFDQIHSDVLVSVITPTYDRIELLLNAVKCVKEQTYPNIEHIIVGDNCPKLMENKDLLLRINPDLIIINLETSNVSYGPARIARVRNMGVKASHGTLIAHLDDDNAWEPNHIETLKELFRVSSDIGIALSQRKLLINGSIPYTFPCHPWSNSLEEGKRIWEAYNRMGIYSLGSCVMSDRIAFHEERDVTADTNEMLVRRELHELYPFLETFPKCLQDQDFGEDDIFCMQIHNGGFRVAFSKLPTLLFRLGGRFTELIVSQLEGDVQNDTV